MSRWTRPDRSSPGAPSGVLRAQRPALAEHPAWTRRGERLEREVRCVDFPDALEVVTRLGTQVEHFGRRPDIAIVDGNRVRISVANPNHAGITRAELSLVDRVDRVLERDRPAVTARAA